MDHRGFPDLEPLYVDDRHSMLSLITDPDLQSNNRVMLSEAHMDTKWIPRWNKGINGGIYEWQLHKNECGRYSIHVWAAQPIVIIVEPADVRKYPRLRQLYRVHTVAFHHLPAGLDEGVLFGSLSEAFAYGDMLYLLTHNNPTEESFVG